MQAGDYGERRSEPWTYSRATLPLMVYSTRAMNRSGPGKTLRVRYRRKKNYFKIEDAQRILVKLQPPPDAEGSSWSQKVIAILREATLQMLQRILPFLPDGRVEQLYDFSIQLLDSFFRKIGSDLDDRRRVAKSVIVKLASENDVKITFPK